MKVWQIDPAQMTPYYNVAVCSSLTDAGCDVTYITSKYLYDDYINQDFGFQTKNLYFQAISNTWWLKHARLRQLMRGIFYPLGHIQLLRLISQHKPDIVHFQWSRLPKIDTWLIRRIKAMGIPVVHTIHDVVPLYNKSSETGALDSVYQLADRLIVHAETNKADFLNHYINISSSKIRVVPLVHLRNPPMPVQASMAYARSELNLPQDAFVVSFIGLVRESKGLVDLVEAFKTVYAQNRRIYLLIAGKPRSTLESAHLNQVSELPNVIIDARYIPNDAMWKYHIAANIVAFPYRHIYQSAALITAMGFGCPVIVTNVGGMPEIIDGNGWIIPPDQPETLAETLLEAISDPHRLQQMGQRSVEIVEQRHSPNVVGQQLLNIYQELLP